MRGSSGFPVARRIMNQTAGEGAYLDAFNHTKRKQRKRRRPIGKNEIAAMAMQRDHGWSYNIIGECFDRSTSFVKRHVKKAAETLRSCRQPWIQAQGHRMLQDLRKLPGTIKRHLAQIQRSLMLKLQLPYLLFATGEADEPP